MASLRGFNSLPVGAAGPQESWEVAMARQELIIKATHRGLWYEDGVLTQVLGAGRHVIP